MVNLVISFPLVYRFHGRVNVKGRRFKIQQSIDRPQRNIKIVVLKRQIPDPSFQDLTVGFHALYIIIQRHQCGQTVPAS